MLRIEDLAITPGTPDGRNLFAGLSMTVKPGDSIGVTGPSGCGKSTLLRSIVGLIDPADGAVTLDDKTPGEIGWPAFRRRVGLVPQRPVVFDGSVASNLQRPRTFDSIRQSGKPKDGQQMLERVGLADKLNAQASELSEGERQRVCLVRALLAEPDFLLLDEPTSALDGEAVACVEALLVHEMAETRLGVLIATHDSAQAQRLCSRVIDLTPLCMDMKPAGGGADA